MARKRTRLLHRSWVRGPLAGLAAGYMRLVARTGRWTVQGNDEALALIRARVAALGAFWHGRLLMIPWVWRAMLEAAGRDSDTRAYCLISTHGDGAFMADAARRLGAGVVDGSARRGGTEALLRMRSLLSQGECVAIATDGPRGPRMRVKPGIVQLASITGAPIIPLAFAASNQRLINSWDRFALPLPFARGVLAWGAPLRVPEGADAAALEAARSRLERALTDLTDRVDGALGLAPVEPAPVVYG